MEVYGNDCNSASRHCTVTKKVDGMTDIKLPIDVMPGTNPPIFRWIQVVDTPNGWVTIDHEEALPSTVEKAVAHLIKIAKQLMTDNAVVMSDRINTQPQSEALKTSMPKKGRG